MALDLTILYRGPLSSCNYDCGYCPFAKHHETAAELKVDRLALERFVDWLTARADGTFGVLFTPWGEALTRPWYRSAMMHLSRLPQIRKVAVQTNLSCPLDWLAGADLDCLGLWCTYHPSQTPRADFLAQCERLRELGVAFSVGTVGMREDFDAIAAMRAVLPDDVYLWVNAFKQEADYYTPAEVQRLLQIDPLFAVNNVRHPSLGKACRTGESVISVDGEGTVRRCHFVSEPLGNLYDPDFEQLLQPRPCPNARCGCHIGYVHREDFPLYELFGAGLLERIPSPAWQASETLLRWVGSFAESTTAR
ncbi:STM4011 family radical SAM protein [Lignipirellula cremea]|uniref:Radical SAM superfamily protein n=1 Tax=Lignipirellula cremea TaxID=2528010 RepID=A0A518DP57_9BACT|nr:STM4011 family radical SAM protein [Lignipirellula cremea]QDU93614.1 hypothetical protein Pla8534_13940 [Lignipirellula cremea]